MGYAVQSPIPRRRAPTERAAEAARSYGWENRGPWAWSTPPNADQARMVLATLRA